MADVYIYNEHQLRLVLIFLLNYVNVFVYASFFIYLSPYVKEITSTSVSYDKNNFALCQEIEEDNNAID